MQSRQVSNFKINKMTKAQYSGIVPSQDEVYITTDEADAVLSVNGILPNAQGNVTLSIPSAVTESTVAGWGFTKNVGTVTSVNGVSPTNGNVAITIPTVNNGMLTITQDGNTLGTFSANQSGNATVDIPSGGSSRNVGEIVASTIPLTDAGLHLLDGALISGSGSYSAFVDYIAGLVTDYPDLFDTEANWQSEVTQYGVCGKFVYDSVNNTVRLPKITGIVEGTTDLTALGDLVQAGLPNITGGFYAYSYGNGGSSQAFTGSISNPNQLAQGTSSGFNYDVFNFNASRSSSIYGNSSTVQPQAIKVLYYIVIATSTKTNIEVDIDEIATDLNGKADRDGSNMVSSVKNFDGQWVASTLTLANGVTYPTTTDTEYSLSTYLPNDNYNYEVIFMASVITGTTSGNGMAIRFHTDMFNDGFMLICNTITRTNSATLNSSMATVPIGSGRKFIINASSSYVGTYTVTLKGYRRIGTNS